MGREGLREGCEAGSMVQCRRRISESVPLVNISAMSMHAI